MKKIGLLVDTMNSGGAQRVVTHLSEILENDYQVHVILFEDTYQEYVCHGKQLCLQVPACAGGVATKLKLLWKRTRELRKLIRQEKLDCIISFMDSPNFVNLLTWAPDCRKIISIRNYSGLENRQSFLGKLTDMAMKVLYRQADTVVTVSKLIERDFMVNYGVPQKKLRTIYNPYPFRKICEDAEMPLPEMEQAFLDGHFTFVNVGRIMYQKGIWHLVKAFSLVKAQKPEVRLVLVGEDLSGGKLTELIHQLHLEEAVLLTGRKRNPYPYMKAGDCYVLSSLFEGFPNAMVESMICGCSVIAADCKSGPREILCEKPDLHCDTYSGKADYGILVPAMEPEENWNAEFITDGERILAKAMLEHCQNREEAVYYSQLAEKRSKVFSYESCRKQFVEVIEAQQN